MKSIIKEEIVSHYSALSTEQILQKYYEEKNHKMLKNIHVIYGL